MDVNFMQTIKQIVHDIADGLPEQATWDDVMYTLYVRQKIEEGLKDVEEGRTLSHEDAMKQLLVIQ
jgi:predicted transcriptional regulator